MQYVARQPILDSSRCLLAYELLFRTSEENTFPGGDLDYASKHTMDTAVLLGVDTISGGHDLFLNCTEESLVLGFPTLFPARTTVVEVLESTKPSSAVISSCRELKISGYRIALDDFLPQSGYEPLIELADIIKIDLRSTSSHLLAAYAAEYRSPERQLLAEKVESKEEFHCCLELGFTMFQGYFFSRPTILSTATVGALAPMQLRALALLGKSQLDFSELDALIRSDPALCYRLLRYLNSPAFYLHAEITSILQALLLLGEEELRRWLLLVCAVVGGMQSSKRHLLTTALIRARFAELIAPAARVPASTMFIVGMLSLMDAILDLPITTVACQVAISAEVRAALFGSDNRLRRCLDLVLAYESADWTACESLRADRSIPADTLSSAYLESLHWAAQFADAVV